MQHTATNLGGKCLSKEYINANSSLKWMCEKGHTWDASYSIIYRGGWCQQCAKNKSDEERLAEISEEANKNGFTFISKKYMGHATRYKFKCTNDHLFTKRIKEFIARPLCYICYREKGRKEELEQILLIVKKHNGLFLSSKYTNSSTKLKFQCSEGHVWITNPSNIKKGNWCRICGRKAGAEKSKYTMQELQAYATKRGGQVLSKKYKTSMHYLRWQCGKGHIWLAMAGTVLQKSSWCPACADNEKRTSIEAIQKLAKKFNGQLISTNYVNRHSSLEWKCANGHIWEATLSQIQRGSRCAICAREKIKTENFNKLLGIAKSKNGKLLSKKYVKSTSKLKWQCEKRHSWVATPPDIVKGLWCPVCEGRKTRKIKPENQSKRIVN